MLFGCVSFPWSLYISYTPDDDWTPPPKYTDTYKYPIYNELGSVTEILELMMFVLGE